MQLNSSELEWLFSKKTLNMKYRSVTCKREHKRKGKKGGGGCLEFFFFNIHFTTNGLYILVLAIKGYVSIRGGNCPNVVNLAYPHPHPRGDKWNLWMCHLQNPNHRSPIRIVLEIFKGPWTSYDKPTSENKGHSLGLNQRFSLVEYLICILNIAHAHPGNE